MITIIWDVDDVLNDLMATWFKRAWLASHSQCSLRYSDLCENPPHETLGVSKEEYLSSLDTFRTGGGEQLLRPNGVILDWLKVHGWRFRHFALTARPLETVSAQAEWLFRNFSAYIRGFGVVPSRTAESTPVYDLTKADYLGWLGIGDVLVDDSEANVEAARKAGIAAILYPQPWNRSPLTPAQAIREVEKAAVTRTAQHTVVLDS